LLPFKLEENIMASRRILIVGGVAGGASCAARLRRLDEFAEIFMFERGGDVSFANCGLPYYLGGTIADRRQLLVATPERFRDVFRIEVRTRHEVRSIDRGKKIIEVQNLQTGAVSREAYDVLVLAPGAAPIRPPLPGIDLPGIFSLRSLQDADAIQSWLNDYRPPRAIVIGAGYIGLEMAENFSRRGMEVEIIERLNQALPQMDPEMVSPLYQELHKQGVDLRLESEVAGFEPGADNKVFVLTKKNERHVAGMVVLALGVKPDVELAKQCGLEIGPTGGIRVDGQMRTSDESIYAVGDAVEVRDFITGKPALIPLAGPANRQGRIAADAICGRNVRYRGSQGTAVLGAFDLTLAMTGAIEKTLRREAIAYQKSYTHSSHHAGYYPGAERISLKLLFTPDTGRLLGAQAVGKAGVDKRIDVLAAAIQKGATVFDLEEAELCYAPQYGSAKDPVNIAGFVAGNILRGDVAAATWADWKALAASGQTLIRDCPDFCANKNGTVPFAAASDTNIPATPPIILDVRPPAALASGSIPGAIHIPLGELRSRLNELPKDKEIWVHCVVGQTAYYAARILTQHGFKARNISGGFTSYKMEEKQ
jgi:NADPH-dependent 2,4-dienoyl-CoA reductase/sulfur reductase-like enzyme/rhodanese-related sulfurtransferase